MTTDCPIVDGMFSANVGETMGNHRKLPEALRKRMLDAVDVSIAFNELIGRDQIRIDGVIVFTTAATRSTLDKLTELRGLLVAQTI